MKDLEMQLRSVVFGNWGAEEERSYTDIVDQVADQVPLPPLVLIKIAYGVIVSQYLAKHSRTKNRYIRSVRKGWWKREDAATRDEVSHNQNTRLRTAHSMAGNVATEIADKATEMPDLKKDVAGDLEALVELMAEELGLDL